MSDPKVQNMAKTFLEHGITKMFDTALKAMEVDLKKDPKAYYKASRLVFKALMAASAQKLLEDGANRALLRDTYSPEDAWVLFLDRHPAIAKKLAPPEPKAPPKPKFQVFEGGKLVGEETPEQVAAALDADEEDGSCGCACHFEHGEWEVTGHNCCINETHGDEVLKP